MLLRRALKTRGRSIKLEQRVRAESDVAVAAASILAREGFLYGMHRLGEELDITLPKGAGAQVKKLAQDLFARDGYDVFSRCAKLHFKTYAEVTGDRAYLKNE
jgi:ribonuclease HIII